MATVDPFEQAADLYTQHRYAEASTILQRLVAEHPDHVEYRHALAMCQQNLSQVDEAIANFRFVLDREPRRFEDAYRLGYALQIKGAYSDAAAAYRIVLTHSDYRDTRDRLVQCEQALRPATSNTVLDVTGEVSSPKPLSIRQLVVDQGNFADRGAHTGILQQQTRHLLPSAGRMFAATVAASLILTVVSLAPAEWLAVFDTSPGSTAHLLRWLLPALALAVWLALAGRIGYLALSAKYYTVDVFERGIDVAGGLLDRGRQFIWYYQMPLEPAYVRSGWMFLTHTASLRLKYNELATTSVDLELPGIGSPAGVQQLRAYIEHRRLVERLPIRGPFS